MIKSSAIVAFAKVVGLVVVVAAVAGSVSAFVVRRIFTPTVTAQGPKPVPLPEWKHYATAGQLIGSADAPKVIVVFSDFQCQYCAKLHSDLEAIVAQHPTEVRVLFRNYPISSIHPLARAGAEAGVCAATQSAFRPFAAMVFKRQPEIGATTWVKFAQEAGIRDVPAFEACLADSNTKSQIAADMRLGNELGVTGTPTLIVAGQVIRGAAPRFVLDSLLGLR